MFEIALGNRIYGVINTYASTIYPVVSKQRDNINKKLQQNAKNTFGTRTHKFTLVKSFVFLSFIFESTDRYKFFYMTLVTHDDIIKWKHFPRYWPFVRGIHRSPVNSPHKGQWRGAFMFSLICVWINGWVNNGEAGDSRRYRAHYDVTVMSYAVVACAKFAVIWWSEIKLRQN